MKSSHTNTRSSRRRNRKGPIHFAQGLFLETLGFGALIVAMLGLGRENFLLTLISSPVNENQTASTELTPSPANQPFTEIPAFEPKPTTSKPQIGWTTATSTQSVQSTWQPAPTGEPYLGHNSPWTSRH